MENIDSSNDKKSVNFDSTAKIKNNREKINFISNLKETGFIILTAIILHFLIRTMVMEVFFVPTGSMIPTILIDDHILITKYSYGYGNHSFYLPMNLDDRFFSFGNEPQRGDVVIFHSDLDDQKTYIKRVIGLPGDKIRLDRGELIINGISVPKKPAGTYKAKLSVKSDGDEIDDSEKNREVLCDRYIEELPNGVKYYVLYHQEVDLEQFPNTTREYTVPQLHYFMMGDNRNYSIDSRFIDHMGLIKSANIKGKARAVIYNRSLLSLLKGESGLRNMTLEEGGE